MEDYERICQDIKECIKDENCKKLIEEAQECLKKEKNELKEEKERLENIKKSLDNSYYSKIFDTAIENVKVREQLEYRNTVNTPEIYTYYNAPNIALLIKWLSLIIVIFSLYYVVNCTIDNIHKNNITEKLNQTQRENNESL